MCAKTIGTIRHAGEKTITFKEDQLAFIERVAEHSQHVIEAVRTGNKPKQRVFLLLGSGGCGKTEIIRLFADLVDMFQCTLTKRMLRPGQEGTGPSTILCANTNAAAANIGGDTIHSALMFNGKQRVQMLDLN